MFKENKSPSSLHAMTLSIIFNELTEDTRVVPLRTSYQFFCECSGCGFLLKFGV